MGEYEDESKELEEEDFDIMGRRAQARVNERDRRARNAEGSRGEAKEARGGENGTERCGQRRDKRPAP